MKTSSLTIVAASAILLSMGCSKASREDAIDNVASAARALNGGDSDERTPDVVRKQQEAERKRQNTKWTPENQAKHPIEYCQAQLEELDANSKKLDVGAHKLSLALNTVKRENSNDEASLATLEKFLTTAKQAYRDADAANSWPVQIGGYALSKEKAQEKIVEAARKIPDIKGRIAARANQLTALQKKLDIVNAEQKRLAAIREKVQTTIRDLETRRIIEGDSSVADALNAISDSMGALTTSFDDPSVEDMAAPSSAATLQDDFNAIMAE